MQYDKHKKNVCSDKIEVSSYVYKNEESDNFPPPLKRYDMIDIFN